MARYTAQQIYAFAREAGFERDQATTMTAVALAESGGRNTAHATRGEDSRGLWQINADAHPGLAERYDLFDPRQNAAAAFEVSQRGEDVSPWTTTHGGARAPYLRHRDAAQAAAVAHGDPAGLGMWGGTAGYGDETPAGAAAPALAGGLYGAQDADAAHGLDLAAEPAAPDDGAVREVVLGETSAVLTGNPFEPWTTDPGGNPFDPVAAAPANPFEPAAAAPVNPFDPAPPAAAEPSDVVAPQPIEPPSAQPPATPPVPAQGGEPALAQFVGSALEQTGDRYVFGANVPPAAADPAAFDCSELVRWSAHRAGVDLPDGSWLQFLELQRQGLVVPVEQGVDTRGALLFSFSTEPVPGGPRPGSAHVAISLGDGSTIEARGRAYGVGSWQAGHRFEYAALVPGISSPGAAAATTLEAPAAPAGDPHGLDLPAYGEPAGVSLDTDLGAAAAGLRPDPYPVDADAATLEDSVGLLYGEDDLPAGLDPAADPAGGLDADVGAALDGALGDEAVQQVLADDDPLADALPLAPIDGLEPEPVMGDPPDDAPGDPAFADHPDPGDGHGLDLGDDSFWEAVMPDGVSRLLDTVDGLAAAVGRDDVRGSLAEARGRTLRADCHVLVVGEFSQGKSALVNALVGAPVCGVSATAATAVTTVVRHAGQPVAHLLVAPDLVDGVPAGDPRRVPIPLAAAPAAALRGTDEEGRPLLAVEIGLPRGLLAEGLVLVDTPGVGGGFAAARAAVTMRALSVADALVLVTDAAHELTAPEIEFLRHALELCPVAVCALTKTDLYPEWERIAELDRGHLRAAGLAVDVLPLATPLRELALDTGDPALWAESGYAVLSTVLATSVLGRRREAAGRSAVTAARAALGQLDRQLETERATLADPAGRPERMSTLQEAKQHAERMQSASARWQHVLADQVRLAGRELVEDLDARTAALRRAAQERLDGEDPARSWGDFEPWLTARTNAELTAHHQVLLRRSAAMAAEVAAEFDLDVADLPARSWLRGSGATPRHAREVEQLTAKRVSTLDLGMNAARGFSLSSSVAGTVLYIVAPLASIGLAVTLPILAGLGAVFALRSARSSRDAQLRQARAEASRLVAGYLDQTRVSTWRADEDTIDGLRRALRDHFAARAAELVGGARADVAAAVEAAQVHESAAGQRLRQAELRSRAVRRVAHAVDDVLGSTATQGPDRGALR